MTDTRRRNFEKTILVVASLLFVGLGALRASYPHNDFVRAYAGAYCLLHGCNPYHGTSLLYPPSTLVAVLPLALFSFRTAWLLWLAASGGLLILAAPAASSSCVGSVSSWVKRFMTREDHTSKANKKRNNSSAQLAPTSLPIAPYFRLGI